MSIRTVIASVVVTVLSGCATHIQDGNAAMARGDLAAAERQYSAAAQAGDPTGYNNLGVVAERRGDRERAIGYYTMAARWGNKLAAQNLVNLGAPVPSADLAAQRASTNAAQTAASLEAMRLLNPPRAAATTCHSVHTGGGNYRTVCQ